VPDPCSLTWTNVGPLRTSDLRAQTDRSTTHCTDSLLLAHHVLTSMGRPFEGGGLTARTSLIRTPEMVEEGVRRALQDYIPSADITKHGMQLQPSSLKLMPDLLFGNRDALADVKYKLATGEWKRPDLYQIVTFATGFRIAHAAVIEFGDSTTTLLPALHVGDVHVQHLAWAADADRPPSEAATQFVAAVQTLIARPFQVRRPPHNRIVGVLRIGRFSCLPCCLHSGAFCRVRLVP
jgi:hypothetical protein